MVEIEIDGKKVKAEPGSSLLQVTLDAGKPIPYFCYHKKLSVTASCRMCLVEVEKMPKHVPACATQVMEGMVVHTDTEKVAEARRAAMEFLLINHPLDCPVCDQGGECRLQDYAVEYGANASRYSEEKRVVVIRDIGPLVSMKEMGRCIQCTRCVRFGEEIAGLAELGVINRGELSEISTFLKAHVHSELSGNMIDVCPVGALTSKPFRYTARGWELANHFGISPHDGLGSNMRVQTLRDKVMRVLPFENEAVNECWLSDRDRFSYEALNDSERLTVPMVKQDNHWIETDWETALNYVAHGLRSIRNEHGAMSLAALVSPQATLEECFLMQKLLRGMGSEKIEFRLRQSDFSLDGKVVPWLGMHIDGIDGLDSALIVGSFLRQDVPLLATRFRKAAQAGAEISMLHAVDDDWLMPVENKLVAPPTEWLLLLGEIICAIAERKGIPIPEGFEPIVVSETARQIAVSLMDKARTAVFMGSLAWQHEKASLLHRVVEWIAQETGASLGYLTEGANTSGAFLAGAFPKPESGVLLEDIASESTKAFLLLHTEPELEAANQPKMFAALKQAEMVVAMSPFKQSMDYADVLLPISPFSETSGTYVSFEGRVQSFEGAVAPLGETRPAWKVLRVLGNFLDLPGFGYDTSEEVRDECLGRQNPETVLNNISCELPLYEAVDKLVYVRVANLPSFFSDVIVRRAESLQQTQWAKSPVVHLPEILFNRLRLTEGESIRVVQQEGEAILPACCDGRLPENVVMLPTGHAATAMLGPIGGWVRVERV